MMFGDLAGLKLPDTQETCPDRESNPRPLLGKRACYHLLHSGGPQESVPCSMCGVVGTVPTFQPIGPSLILLRGQGFQSLYWNWACVLCVLSSVVSGGGPDILIITDSVRDALVFLSTISVSPTYV